MVDVVRAGDARCGLWFITLTPFGMVARSWRLRLACSRCAIRVTRNCTRARWIRSGWSTGPAWGASQVAYNSVTVYSESQTVNLVTTLAVELSEAKTELQDMAADADAPSEKLTEAKARVRSLDERHVAAQLAASPADDTFTPDAPVDEDPRMRELVGGANISSIFEAVRSHSGTTGKERELQTELKMQANQIPLVMLADPLVSDAGDGDGARMRTTGQSSAPGEVGQRQTSIIPAVFPAGSAAFLQIPQPVVPTGKPVYSPITTSASPGTPAAGAEQADSAATITAFVLEPQRIAAGIFYRREDAAVLAGMNAALVANLRSALSDELDQYVLQGATVGLLTGTNLDSHNASSADDYASYLKRFCFDAVDGISANRTADLRLVVGTGTFGSMASEYRGNASPNQALGELERITDGVRVSANVPAVVSNKQNGLVRVGGPRLDAVAPIWDGIEVETDRFTQAKSGEIRLNAVMLAQFQVLRKSGFRKVQAQTA